jgi:hypothetical protein
MTDKRERREPIHELDKKINFLIESPLAQKICGHRRSVNSFCEKTGIARSTLREAIGGIKPNMLSSTAQRKLADKCRFAPEWEEWVDPKANQKTPNEKRKDTAADFEQRYLRENDSPAPSRPAKPRRTDVRLKVDRPYAAQAFDQHLGCVDLHASQPGAGDPWPIGVDLICWPAPVEGVVIAVKRGRLYIDCNKAHTTDLKDRVGYPSGADYSREACKIIIRPGGTSQRPSWEVFADPGPIGLLALPHDFCLIFDAAAGDIITASFNVYIKDLDLVESHEPDCNGDVVPQEESISFMRPDFKKLGNAKQKILKRLAELKLPGGDSGWAQLCRVALQFKEIGNGTDE